MQGEVVQIAVIVLLIIAILGGAIGIYFRRRHQSKLEAMSAEERELHDAKKEYKKSVRKAERELWTATKSHEAKVLWARGILARATRKGQGHVDSYTGVHGSTVELYENRVKVPRSGTKGSLINDLPKTASREHYFQNGPVEARVEKHGLDEMYLIVEGDNFVGFVQCKPDDAPQVRELAVKINNASRSIHSILQARNRAVAKATSDLEATLNNRASIEAATERLNAVKGDTSRVDIAYAKVERHSPKIKFDPPEE